MSGDGELKGGRVRTLIDGALRKNEGQSIPERETLVPADTPIAHQLTSDGPNTLKSRNQRIDNVIEALHRCLSEQALLQPARSEAIGGHLTGATARRVRRTRDRALSESGNQDPAYLRVARRVEELRELVSLGEEIGIDTSTAASHLSRTATELGMGRLTSANALATTSERIVRMRVSNEIPSLLRATRTELRRLDEEHLATSQIERSLTRSREASRRGDLADAMRSLRAAQKAVKSAQNDLLLRIISSSKGRFVSARKLGIDIEEAVDMLNNSRDQLKGGNFPDAVRLAREATRAVDDLLESHKETHYPLAEGVRAMKLAEALGADVSALEPLFNEASRLSRLEDLPASESCAKRLIEEAEAAAYDKAAESYGLAERALSLATKASGEVSTAREKLDMSRELLERGELARSVAMSSASLVESDSAIATMMIERLGKIDEFSRGVERDADSLSEVQEAIENSKLRNLEHLKKYADVSERIVNEAYENAAAYARVAQDVVKQAYDRSMQCGNLGQIEVRDSDVTGADPEIEVFEGETPEERRQRAMEMFLKGRVSESQLHKLLTVIDSSVVKDKLV